jgi:hypothetical protein
MSAGSLVMTIDGMCDRDKRAGNSRARRRARDWRQLDAIFASVADPLDEEAAMALALEAQHASRPMKPEARS